MVTVAFFGGALGLAHGAEDPLDDPDPAFQRPGLLDLGDLPEPAPAFRADVELTGRSTVVFFELPARMDELCRALQEHQFDSDVQTVMIAPSESPTDDCPDRAVVVVDPALPDAFGLRRPRQGGAPVGYAIIDENGRIRYRTLDRAVPSLLGEVDTILGALP